MKKTTAILTTILAIAVLIFSAGSGSSQPAPITAKGVTLSGEAGYFEAANFFHINISIFSSDAGQTLYSNVSNNVGTSKDVTLSFSSNVILTSFYNGTTITVNSTILPINGSNETSLPVNQTNWTSLPLTVFNNTLTGVTFKGFPPGMKQYSYTLTPVNPTGKTKYSIYLNTTILEQQVWLEFDPEVGINVFRDNVFGFAKTSRPSTNTQPIDNINDGLTPDPDFYQTGSADQVVISVYINLSQGQAVNKTTWDSYSASYEPTDYNISGSNDNVTWTVLKSVTGNTAEDPTDDFVNTASYIIYLMNITKWNDGVSSGGGLAVREWYGYNTTFADTTAPILNSNGTNFTTIAQGETGQFSYNFTEPVGLIVEHNMTGNGIPTNISIAGTGVTNASANITMITGNWIAFYIKPYANDTLGNMNNTINKAHHTTTGPATETEGDAAILTAIQSQIPTAKLYANQKVYVVNASNTQWQGTTDYLAIQDHPPKRWILNYITSGEAYLNARNLSNTVYILEIAGKTTDQITNEATALISATKG